LSYFRYISKNKFAVEAWSEMEGGENCKEMVVNCVNYPLSEFHFTQLYLSLCRQFNTQTKNEMTNKQATKNK
jgi:hypothetical protein